MSTSQSAMYPASAARLAGEADVIEAARRVHRALGDTNRLAVVRRLAMGSATVSELIASTGLSQPLVSWHLRRLRDAGLVTSERNGRETVCTLRTETIAEGHALMLSALGVANPAAWVAPAAALPNASPLVESVRRGEA
jgi:ArsR family transcriptional regulator